MSIIFYKHGAVLPQKKSKSHHWHVQTVFGLERFHCIIYMYVSKNHLSSWMTIGELPLFQVHTEKLLRKWLIFLNILKTILYVINHQILWCLLLFLVFLWMASVKILTTLTFLANSGIYFCRIGTCEEGKMKQEPRETEIRKLRERERDRDRNLERVIGRKRGRD